MNGLTPRELDVMVALAVTGEDYRHVADLLGIKTQTVKNHSLSARSKMGARSNMDWFRLAGWLRIPDEVHAYRAMSKVKRREYP